MLGGQPMMCKITRRDYEVILCDPGDGKLWEQAVAMWRTGKQTYCVLKAIIDPGDQARHDVTALYQEEAYMGQMESSRAAYKPILSGRVFASSLWRAHKSS